MLPDRIKQLRRIQFTTVLACYNKWDLPPGLPADYWELPDDKRQWPAACEFLASLQHLQYARISIFLMCQLERHNHPSNTELLNEILQPLKAVHASEFTVEVAVPLETVRELLGATPFRLDERESPVCSGLASLLSALTALQPALY